MSLLSTIEYQNGFSDLEKKIADYLIEHKCLPDTDTEIDASDFKEASLDDLKLNELKELAREKGIKGYSSMDKEELKKRLEDE